MLYAFFKHLTKFFPFVRRRSHSFRSFLEDALVRSAFPRLSKRMAPSLLLEKPAHVHHDTRLRGSILVVKCNNFSSYASIWEWGKSILVLFRIQSSYFSAHRSYLFREDNHERYPRRYVNTLSPITQVIVGDVMTP